MPRFQKPEKKTSGSLWISRIFGWIYIAATIGIIYFLLQRPGPKQNLVCDRVSYRPGLTQFGTCHME